jgi:hypothetical protein
MKYSDVLASSKESKVIMQENVKLFFLPTSITNLHGVVRSVIS